MHTNTTVWHGTTLINHSEMQWASSTATIAILLFIAGSDTKAFHSADWTVSGETKTAIKCTLRLLDNVN